eukprot:evm.model.scf_424.6 EVM.evm.TU.scf_424.6   scf_424:57423-62947(+)
MLKQGYLHDGHLSLVKLAREQADIVVASIYVNPTQFAAGEDFDVYPRDLCGDHRKLEEAGCEAVFEPESMYGSGTNALWCVAGQGDKEHVVGAGHSSSEDPQSFVQVERLQVPMEGASRPHFFRGVCTVVTKLFHVVEPDVAVFGLKDYQQFLIIKCMVRELCFPVEIIGGPIGREEDGLAMSSRNARLDPQARQQAPAIHRWLRWAASEAKARPTTAASEIQRRVRTGIEEAGGNVDYVEVVDADTLQPMPDASQQATLVAVAAHFPAKGGGTVRLIDNVVIGGAAGD